MCGGARDCWRFHVGLAGPLAVLSSAPLIGDEKREAEDGSLECGPVGYQRTRNLQGETNCAVDVPDSM